MKMSDTIKELQKENKLLREQINLKEKLKESQIITNYPPISKPKPKLEVGKWYKLTEDYCSLEKGGVYPFKGYQGRSGLYATLNHGIYLDEQKGSFLSPKSCTLIPATDKEVEEALIKEAEKRGFKEGVKVHFKSCDENRVMKGKLYISNDYDNRIIVCFGDKDGVGNIIFKDGKWAEIIEDKVPTIAGHEMEYSSGRSYIKFGCLHFTNRSVKELYQSLSKCEITEFKVDDEHIVTTKQLKEIVDYLDK